MADWLLAACLCGVAAAGAAIALWVALAPTTPELSTVVDRLQRRTGASTIELAPESRLDRVGAWVQSHAGAVPRIGVPDADLDLLGVSSARFHAHKLLWALAGLASPTLVLAWSALIGLPISWTSPVLLGLALAVAGWFLPHLLVRRRAAATRQRFARTITAYIDLVVLERLSGASLAAAIIEPAEVCDAPLFIRIRQAVTRHQLERRPPWVALRGLASDVDLPDLTELADTLELSGVKGAPMADQLKARAADIRNAWLHRDVEAAGAASQRQVATTGLLLLCFLVFVGAPALLRLVAG